MCLWLQILQVRGSSGVQNPITLPAGVSSSDIGFGFGIGDGAEVWGGDTLSW